MAVSFMDKIRLTDIQIVDKYSDIALERYSIEGLDDIINEIKSINEEKYYGNLIKVYLKYDVFYDKTMNIDKIIYGTKKKCEILGYQPINLPPFTRIIACQDLKTLYNFIAGVYVTNLGRKLNESELKIIFGHLDALVIKNLDQFDKVEKFSTINEDYFRKLRKIKWKDKKARSLWLDITELIKFAGFITTKTPIRFSSEQLILTQFLVACNAVNNNRNEMNMDDVIIGFRTYFKLLKADLPTLVDKLWEENKSIVN